MTSKKHLDHINRTNARLAKAEANTASRINNRLASRYSRLERELVRRYDRIRNNDTLLPSQKTAILHSELGDLYNIADSNWEKEFRGLFEKVNNEGLNLGRNLLAESGITKPDDPTGLSDTIDFWTVDSSRRLRGWGENFRSRAQAIVEMGFSQGWGAQRVASELRKLAGSTQSRAEQIVRTASVSVANRTLEAHYQKNNYGLYIWIAVGDDRVCPICAARNGNVYRLNDSKPPAHVRCRCSMGVVEKKDFLNGKVDKAWTKGYRREGLQKLDELGGKPNYGLAPFEKAAGRTEAPTPVWTPEKGFAKGEAPQKLSYKELKRLSLPQLKAIAEERLVSEVRDKRKKEAWISAIRKNQR